MKKKILLLSVIASVMLTGCQDDFFGNKMSGDVKHVTMSVKDFEWNEQTRTSAELTSTGVAFKWAEGDVIGVFPNEGDQVDFLVEDGVGTSNATFNGGGWALKSGYTYVAYYPFNKANYDNGKTAIPMTYAGQTQDGNASLANISKCDYIVSNLSAPESGEVNFQFSHLSALVRFVLTMPKAGTYTKLTLTTENNVIPVERNLDLSGASPVVTNKTMSNEIELSLTNITTAADNAIITLYMLMPECDLTGKTIRVIVGDYTVDLAGKNMKGGKAYSYTATMQKSNTIDFNGHEYVDLGLPSGTLWATCNIGANKPEDYGLYFAWGETTGYTTNGGKLFDWSDYKWCNGASSSKISKYSTSTSYWDSSLGTSPDGKTELDLEDDAAHVNWGGDWRMPSKAQQYELRNNCTWEWTSRNGVSGCVVSGNGNSIFLPAADSRYASSFGVAGFDGNYWSRSLNNTSYSSDALYLFFHSGLVDWSNGYRCYGLSVRAVCSASE